MDYQCSVPELPDNETLASVFDVIDAGICITDSNGNFVHVNRAYCETCGYGKDELMGQPMTMVLPLNLRSSAMEDYLAVGNTEAETSQTVQVLRKDGSSVDVFVTGVRVPQSNGKFVHVSIHKSSHADVSGSSLVKRATTKERDEVLERFGRIMEQSDNEIYIFQEHPLSIIGANRSVEQNLGYSTAELLKLTPLDIAVGMTSDDFHEISKPLVEGTQSVVIFEAGHRRKDGTQYVVETRLQYMAEESPPVFVATCVDISEQRRTEAWTRLSQKIFENTREGILATNAMGQVIFLNKAFVAITGYTAEELLNGDTSFLRNDFNPPGYHEQMWNGIRNTGVWDDEIWGLRKNGTSYAQRLNVTTVTDSSGNVTNYIFGIVDITEQKQAQERMHRLAYYDPLTDLPNRIYFNDRMTQALAEAERSGTRVTIMFVNLDRFKSINKTFGQLTGDNLLRKVADRFREIFSHRDTICHFGGDEFVVMIESQHSVNEIRITAETALVYLNKPYEVHDYVIHASARIGISMFPEHGTTAEMLLRNAEEALNDVARVSGPHFAFYSIGLNARAVERMKIENGLRNAISRGEFFLHFQPQVDMDTGKVCGAEALLRWNSNRRGLIPPTEFIPIAEDTGLIIPIGEWVLREACEQFARWQNEPSTKFLRVSVNISAHQFARSDLVHQIEEIIEETAVDATRLELEITESAVMRNIDEAIRTLKELKELGIAIAVDDFGTGHSSLSYLRRLPIDRLKIDRSFVIDIARDPTNDSIIEAIIALARGLSLNVVAEGVETQNQTDFLRSHGCVVAQGFFYSPPLSADAFTEYLVDRNFVGSPSSALNG